MVQQDCSSENDCFIANWTMAIEIVSFPSQHGGLPLRYLAVYQRLDGFVAVYQSVMQCKAHIL